jgi:hypothetical protein
VANLAEKTLLGKEICQLGIGLYDVSFSWGDGCLGIVSDFDFSGPDGILIRWRAPSDADEARGLLRFAGTLARVLGETITAAKASETELTVEFSSGDRLQVMKNDVENYTIRTRDILLVD